MRESGTETMSISWWNVSVALLVLSAALFLVSRSSADPDLWGHVRFGQDMLQSRSIVTSDPYSYLTSGHEWINHEILTEITFAAAFDLLGPTGLTSVRLAICLLIFLLLYRHLLSRGMTPVRAGVILLLAVPALRIGMVTARPHLFTYLFFAITLLMLEASTHNTRKPVLWLLPALIALWVNFHGGVLAGLGVLAVWATVEIVRRLFSGRFPTPTPRVAALHWPIVATTSALAALINPYGWRLPAFLVKTGTVARPGITEWAPLAIASVHGVSYLVLLGIAGVALARSGRQRHPAAMVVLVLTSLAPMLAVRHLPLSAIAIIVLTAEHITSAWPSHADGRRHNALKNDESGAFRIRRWATALSLGAAATFLGLTIAEARCIRVPPSSASQGYPIRAVDLLARSGVSGNMAVYFDWGEYVIWHLGPRIQVSMDGRRETVYPDSVYREYRNFARGLDRWDSLLDDYPTELALVPKPRFPTYNLLSLKPNWTLVYDDSLSAVFARDDYSELHRLRSTAATYVSRDARCRCFP